MSSSAQGNVKHSRIRAILVRTCYCTNIFPFPPGFQLLPTSPEIEKTETLPLKVSNFSLASYGNKLHAGTCSMETFLHGSHARSASSFAPRAGAAAAPVHPALAPRSVREIVRSVQLQGKGLLCEVGKRDNKEMDWGISIAHRTPRFLGSHYFSCIKCTFSLPKMMFPYKELEKGIDRA